MILNAAIMKTPRRRAFHGIAYKTILHFQPVIREFFIVVQSPKAIFKTIILIVAHTQNAVSYLKGVAEVFTQFVTGNFWNPVVEVFTVKQRHPRTSRILFYSKRPKVEGLKKERQKKKQ